MQIVLLGTGGYYANDRRQTACIALPEHGVVVDGGSALFRLPEVCQKEHIHLFLTHAHLDHIVGLPSLLMPLMLGTFQQVTVYATADVLGAIRTHLFSDPLFPVAVPFACEEIEPTGSRLLPDGLLVEWQPLLSHPGGSLAYRCSASAPNGTRRVAYVTDTQVDGTYTDFIRGVDLLIHECYFPDGREQIAAQTGHCCASQVAELAHSAQVQRLIAVHFDPTTDDEDPVGLDVMQARFPATELGSDRMLVRI